MGCPPRCSSRSGEASTGCASTLRPEPPSRQLLAQAGRLPLPPYISREPDAADAERYQTVYARSSGSVAAPTAGLHFTEATFAALEARGVQRAMVTLDVGPGTFLPVREEELDKHKMHPERYGVSEETAAAVNAAKAEGRRVVAVGTTVVRTLESATDPRQGSCARAWATRCSSSARASPSGRWTRC